jgi:hypothetical protein
MFMLFLPEWLTINNTVVLLPNTTAGNIFSIKFYFMRKRLLKIILLTSIVSIGISSCKKEPSFDRNTPPDEVAGARPPGKGKPRPPVANAGSDQTITLPTNTVALDGSASTDTNNDIASYLWTKISGPSSFTIANANSVQTQVTNLVEGVYEFELKVTDARGLFDRDTVQVPVTVWPPPPCTTCKIVFVSARDGNGEIYACNTDGSNITRLTNHPDYDDQPVWSPDGTHIAFVSNRDGYYNLYIMNADGSNILQRTFSVDPNGWIAGLTWAPDGTKITYSESIIYFEEEDFSTTSSIYVVSATSGSPILLLNYGDDPAWSPDGTKIALRDLNDIYTINPDGTGLTPLTVGINTGYYNFSFGYPSWSPNGAKLAMEYRGSNNNGVPTVSVMNSDGSGFTLLPASGGSPTSWSADGTIILYNSWSGSMDNVSWVAANGSAGGTIVTNGWNADWQH